MNCKKARDLIITDYLDDQMDEREKARIEEHLESCRECKEFSISARKVGGELFTGADRANVPEYLWRRVRETILAQRRERSATFTAWRPVLAFASVVIIILAIGTAARLAVNNRPAVKTSALAQTDYFDYLTETAADSSVNNIGNFGTSIEQYFM